MSAKIALVFSTIFLIAVGFFYYPKWEKVQSEATISWDVSGYYLYLPATFIYKDLKQLAFYPTVLEKYKPTPDFQQAFKHEASGNYVLKYACGQAVQYAPFFFLAHLYALNSADYEADGYSYPYQLGIGIGNLVVAFVGLFFLMKVLRLYFDDKIVAITLLLIALSTNYLEYTAITGAMTHNYLFTLYAILLWLTIQFYKKPTYLSALGIGTCIGLAALTRPTEIIACLLPILWGISSIKEIPNRLNFFKTHWLKLVLAVLTTGLIGSLQLLYWKYATGDFIVYSYEDQGFSWLNPHILDCTIRFRAGWLIYTPSMIFALLGFYFLYRSHRQLFWATLLFSLLFMYIAFAWDIWWYGGSLGQRAMIQAYPVLAIPFAAFWQAISKKKILPYVFGVVAIFFVSYNLWLHHQAHRGGLLKAGFMTKAYFWEIFGKFDVPLEARKYLDTNEKFKGTRKDIQEIYQNTFDVGDLDSTALSSTFNKSAPFALKVSSAQPFSPKLEFPATDLPIDARWLRVTAHCYTPAKEWTDWRMTQLIVGFWNGDEKVKSKMIRVHRLLASGQWKRVWIDTKIPKKPFTKVQVLLWNTDSSTELYLDDLIVESYH